MPHVSGEDQALDQLLRFGGFPQPLTNGSDSARKRWQNQYFTDLVREDVLEFSRIHEIRAMGLLLEMLRHLIMKLILCSPTKMEMLSNLLKRK
jgi:predicted AAA+ superfamily ATPase